MVHIVFSPMGATILGGIIAWASAYLQVKAQNFANREDLDKLTAQLRQTTQTAEAIKTEISGELWVKQKRWDLKFQCYSQIIENLGEITSALNDSLRVIAQPHNQYPRAVTRRGTKRYNGSTRRRFASISTESAGL